MHSTWSCFWKAFRSCHQNWWPGQQQVSGYPQVTLLHQELAATWLPGAMQGAGFLDQIKGCLLPHSSTHPSRLNRVNSLQVNIWQDLGNGLFFFIAAFILRKALLMGMQSTFFPPGLLERNEDLAFTFGLGGRQALNVGMQKQTHYAFFWYCRDYFW